MYIGQTINGISLRCHSIQFTLFIGQLFFINRSTIACLSVKCLSQTTLMHISTKSYSYLSKLIVVYQTTIGNMLINCCWNIINIVKGISVSFFFGVLVINAGAMLMPCQCQANCYVTSCSLSLTKLNKYIILTSLN